MESSQWENLNMVENNNNSYCIKEWSMIGISERLSS
jgi:hypothetical protein